MMKYAKYDFYVEEYQGSLSDDLFNSLILRASRVIDNNVNCNITESVISRLTDDEKYRIQYVACELCDYLNGNEGVGSFSIDGVSVNITKQDASTKKNEILSYLPQKLTRYL